jgi:hypothetical protein
MQPMSSCKGAFMHRPILCGLLCGVLVVVTACNSRNPFFAPVGPSTPLVPVTDTFSGTVTPNGAVTHDFGVQAGGRVTATLKSLSPDDAVVGLSLGTWNGSACQIVLANDSARLNAVVIGQASGLGNLCVRVYDVGSISQSTSYEVEVVHP